MSALSKVILVAILLVIGYFLLPYVKPNEGLNKTTKQDSGKTVDIKTFTSERLGVSFQYNPDQDSNGEVETDAAEEGDKVYVYFTGSPKTDGQSAEYFTKDPNESLDAAIKSRFLKGIAEKDCYVTEYPISENQPANIITRQIAYPIDQTNPNATLEELMVNRAKCPQDYSLTNGIQYFWMDSNHPDKFFFFKIGQYAILAEPYNMEASIKTWQDTFQVIR